MAEIAHAVTAQRDRHSDRPPSEHVPRVERYGRPDAALSVATVSRALARGAMFIVLSVAATVGYWAAFAIVVIAVSAVFIFGGRFLAAVAAWLLGS